MCGSLRVESTTIGHSCCRKIMMHSTSVQCKCHFLHSSIHDNLVVFMHFQLTHKLPLLRHRQQSLPSWNFHIILFAGIVLWSFTWMTLAEQVVRYALDKVDELKLAVETSIRAFCNIFLLSQRDQILLEPTTSDVLNCGSKGKSPVMHQIIILHRFYLNAF